VTGSVREQPLVHADVFVHERQRRAKELRDASGARDCPVARLDFGRQTARGCAHFGGLRVSLGRRRAHASANGGLEDRLCEPDSCFLGDRQRQPNVRGEGARSRELIERSIGRVHEGSEIEATVGAGPARAEGEGGEAERSCFAHRGVCAVFVELCLGEREIGAQRLPYVGVDGVGER
jgi:hypothetical protein